jgi:hypothetical protein
MLESFKLNSIELLYKQSNDSVIRSFYGSLLLQRSTIKTNVYDSVLILNQYNSSIIERINKKSISYSEFNSSRSDPSVKIALLAVGNLFLQKGCLTTN